MRLRELLIASIANALITSAHAAPPKGFTIPESTLSPNERFGVLVPDAKRYDAGGKNSLVEVATGRVLAPIKAEPGMERMSHGGVEPARWSADSSVLLWQVSGKWFPRALVLIKLSGNAVQWQVDLLKTAQQEILARTRQAAPDKYAAAKKENAGSGSAYPDGFTINVIPPEEDSDKPLTLPLRLDVTLTANPKGDEGFPENASVRATMQAEVDAAGKFNVLKFELE